ncbi:MAG: serine hydrolase domain-containing protein, partial [Terriglobia bacterium]
MAVNAPIQGECDQRFDRVKRVFAENFDQRGELGASVAITLDGRPIVDLWGGHLDHARTKPWQRDNIVNVWSTTKGLTAICAHRLAGEGRLDFNAPVAKY